MKTRKHRLGGAPGLFGFLTSKKPESQPQETGQLSNYEKRLLAPVKIGLEKELTRNTKSFLLRMSGTNTKLYNLQQSDIKNAINAIDNASTIDDYDQVKSILKRFIFNNICDTGWRRYIKYKSTNEQTEQQNTIKQLLKSLFSQNCNTHQKCAEIILQQIIDVIPNLEHATRQLIYPVLKQQGVDGLEIKIRTWLSKDCDLDQDVMVTLFGTWFNKEPNKSQVNEIIRFGEHCYRRLNPRCNSGGTRKKLKRKTRRH